MNKIKEKQTNSKYWIMCLYVLIITVLYYAIYIGQYGFTAENVGAATYNSLFTAGIMMYGYRMFTSYLIGITAGIIGCIYNLSDWQFTIFFSLFGLLILIIRILHNWKHGTFDMPDKPLARIDRLIETDYFQPIKIDSLYRAMMIVLMLTVIFNIKTGVDAEVTQGTFLIAFIICIPLFIGILYGINSEDVLVFGFIAHAVEFVYHLEYLVSEPSVLVMFQGTERLMLMITCAYAYWFSYNIERNENVDEFWST